MITRKQASSLTQRALERERQAIRKRYQRWKDGLINKAERAIRREAGKGKRFAEIVIPSKFVFYNTDTISYLKLVMDKDFVVRVSQKGMRIEW